MLQRVAITNFRCFRKASLQLGPLTALVGPNASGKTALLKGILGRATDRDVWQRDQSLQGRIAWKFTSRDPVELTFSAKGRKGEFPLRGNYLHVDTWKARQRRQVKEEKQLLEDAENLVNVFATIPRREQEALSQQLCKLIPVLQDVTVRPANTGNHRLMFQDRWQDTLWYEPSEVSDGTILTLALLILQYQPSAPDIVAIEEPEHGLHPYLLGDIVAVLRKLALGEATGHPVQIVMATQSAELLEFLEPEEVRFLSRNAEDGSVSVEAAPTDTEDWRRAYEAHQQSLGSLWLSGGIGGVPAGG